MKLVRFLSLSLNLASLGALAADPGTLPPPASRPSGLPIAEPRRAEPVDFEREILPILKENCLACHNQTKAKAGLILETPQTILKGGDSGPALVPGRGAESLLLKAAAHQLEDTIMPPVGNKSNARNLTPEELGLLKLWIDQGARGEVRGLGAVEWQPLPDQFNPIYAVALTSDGRFAACNRGNRLFVYHLPAGRLEARLADPQFAVGASNVLAGAAHRDLVQSLAFSPEGTVLASGSYREVKLWRRRPGGKRWEHPASNALSLAVSPDGQWIALGTDAGTVRLLDGEGHTVGTWPAHETSVHSLAFGPDATQLLTGARDGSARIWSVPGGAAAGRFEVPGGVEAVAWLGSRRIAAAA
ncbi:MAG TPA: c-type cytochrome domain-containing protein, partial [Methylomirabilota bacterium]|nr:c-type cytochrome domain-containing protein [Methylomirabilota bacterium]